MHPLAALRAASLVLGVVIQIAEVVALAKQLRNPSQADEAREI
jgi:hypothetical protein